MAKRTHAKKEKEIVIVDVALAVVCAELLDTDQDDLFSLMLGKLKALMQLQVERGRCPQMALAMASDLEDDWQEWAATKTQLRQRLEALAAGDRPLALATQGRKECDHRAARKPTKKQAQAKNTSVKFN